MRCNWTSPHRNTCATFDGGIARLPIADGSDASREAGADDSRNSHEFEPEEGTVAVHECLLDANGRFGLVRMCSHDTIMGEWVSRVSRTAAD
jgi:hypothetical protein